MRRIHNYLIKLLLLVFLFLQYFGLQLVVLRLLKYLIEQSFFLLLNRQSTSFVVLFELFIVITNLCILHQLLLLMVIPDGTRVLLQAFDCFFESLFCVHVVHRCVIGCLVSVGGSCGGGDCCSSWRVRGIVDNIFTAKRLSKVSSINHLHRSRSILQSSSWVLPAIQEVSKSSIRLCCFDRLPITMIAHGQLVLRWMIHYELSLVRILIRVVFGWWRVSLGPGTCIGSKSAATGIGVSIDSIITDNKIPLLCLLRLLIVCLLSCIYQFPFESQVDDLIAELC